MRLPQDSAAADNGLVAGGLWRNIWDMSWPMLLIMVLNFLVGFVDVYVAGLLGPEIQAAVGFVGQIYFLVIIVANAISVGTLVLITRAVGSGHFERAVDVARQSLIFSSAVALGITAFGLVFSREIIVVAGFPAGIREIAERFFRVFTVALAANYLLVVSNAVFRASGEVRKPLVIMTAVSAVNIAGDFVLVFGVGAFDGLGYLGIAVSTAASLSVGMALSLAFLAGSRWRPLYGRPWKVSSGTLGQIVRLGWPAAMLQIAWNAASIVVYNILGRLGDASVTALASTTNGLRIEAIVYLPAYALNMAASVLVGQNLGAANPERAEAVGWRIAKAGIGLVSTGALVIFVWAEWFASLVTDHPEVLQETALYLRINMVSEPFMALSAVLGGGLQGAGDTKGAMWVIIVAMWLVRLPLAYAGGVLLGYGAAGVWTAMVVSMVIQGLLMGARFRRGRWKHLRVE